ncbi:MAG: hypothetical protein Q9O62_02235 [Ardenticatenia bacterium]|nr:hypothetical protein [Ardenticatenia bacterium]
MALSLATDEHGLVREALRERYGWSEEIHVADRLTAAHAAAGSPSPALVLLADAQWEGIGVNEDGNVQRVTFVGSNAPITLADRPTCVWIGHRGFEAAALSQLGGEPTHLHELLLAHTGAASTQELIHLAHEQAGPAFWTALAVPVATAAREGDEVANHLLDQAGQALGEAALLLAHALDLAANVPTVVVAGAIADLHPVLLRRAGEAINAHLPGAELRPVPHVVAGTLRLALERLGSPGQAWERLARALVIRARRRPQP